MGRMDCFTYTKDGTLEGWHEINPSLGGKVAILKPFTPNAEFQLIELTTSVDKLTAESYASHSNSFELTEEQLIRALQIERTRTEFWVGIKVRVEEVDEVD